MSEKDFNIDKLKMKPEEHKAKPQGDTRKNFDRDASVTFWGLKSDNLLFFGLLRMRVILQGLKN